MPPSKVASTRPPLTKERVVRAALTVADRQGLDALTMRRLGAELDVQAMSLYKHVANKEAILDEVVELIFSEIDVADDERHWQEAMRRRAGSLRRALRRHAWAIGLLESRRVKGPAVLRYLESTLGSLRSAGFTIEDAAHAFWTLDSYVYGHVLQETTTVMATRDEVSATEAAPTGAASARPADYPYVGELAAYAQTHEFSVDREFDHGIDLILDALGRSIVRAG